MYFTRKLKYRKNQREIIDYILIFKFYNRSINAILKLIKLQRFCGM